MKRTKRIRFMTVLLLMAAMAFAAEMAFASEKDTGINASGDVAINKANFPDSAFRSYVSSKYDQDSNGVLSAQERSSVTEIFLKYEEYGQAIITSLKGIEYFTELKTLCCMDYGMTGLDVSGNTKLEHLDVDGNKLESLDLSKNTKLQTLSCRANELESLDVSKNTQLTEIDCSNNELKALNVSKNTQLTILECRDNDLGDLNLSQNTKLDELQCADNELKTLDLSNNTRLQKLFCGDNELQALDVSKNTRLITLMCEKNELWTLDISNNTKLGGLYCYGNHLVAVDIHLAPNLMAAYGGELEARTDDDYTYDFYHKSGTKSKGGSLVSYYYYLAVDTDTVVMDTLPDPPSVKTQPKAATVAEGQRATFKVSAEGTGLSYQWYYRTSSTAGQKAVQSVSGKKAAYSLTAEARHNGYQYRCKVTNPAGSVYSKWVTLKVQTKPVITTQPVAATVKKGATATFTVAASGDELSYQWYYKKPDATSWTKVSVNGTSATYKLTTAARHNGYQYRCKVTNPMGSVYTNTVKLTVVTAKPVIKTQPKSLTVSKSATATFKVVATGRAMNYQWYYKKPGETTWTKVSVNGTSATYTLTTAARHNGFKYYCLVKNAMGSVKTSEVTLTVK